MAMAEITINGKPYPIHFGLKAISRFAQQHNVDFSDMLSAPEALSSFEGFADLAVLGLNDGARRAKSNLRYTVDDVWDIFDDDPQLILSVAEIFVQSITPLVDKLGSLSPNPPRPTR